MIRYKRQLQEIEYDIEVKKSHHKKDTGYETYFSNDILCFDIETTSAFIDNGKIIPYHVGEKSEYWNDLQALALPYIWQFSFNDVTYYGRKLEDFLEVLSDLPSNVNFIIWVHNLQFEFQFLLNILDFDTVFARSKRHPMKCIPKKYSNIEFRCSYYLTRLSLANWGKQIGLKKLVGDLDYEKLRTPFTKLSKKEMGYAERDCQVMYKGLCKYRDVYGTVRNIPLTQTGTVRRVIKDLLTEDKKYVSMVKTLVPKNADEYKMLQDIFAGGYTHANRYWSGEPVIGDIEHFDFASSYPYVMLVEKYPMTPWSYIGKELPDMESFDDNAYILDLSFDGVHSTSFNTYIQASKCMEMIHPKYDNGRVIKAEHLRIKVTEMDFTTIVNNYKWDSLTVNAVYQSDKRYLPKPFIDYILELYGNKTKLKDVEGFEDLYLQSKQYINSMFGMMVTAIVMADITFIDNEWGNNKLTREMVEKRLKSLRSSNPREKRYFLSYSWGCWVTAYARRNLWKCIEMCDHDVLYCDTDSIFVLGHHDFTEYNDEVNKKVHSVCDHYNIDFELTRPKDPKGKEHPIGIFDSEEPCSEFISLGAKRYVERRKKDGKLHLTVSGINKEAVEMLNDDIYFFEDGMNFDKDDDSVTKRLLTYLDDMPTATYPDGYVSDFKYGINVRRNGYKLTVTDEYKQVIDYMQFDPRILEEMTDTRIRAYFE